jgi:hypothetical protein
MSKFEYNTLICTSADKDKIYFISLATNEEISRGEYEQIGDLKISKNKYKHGLIKDIKLDK